MAQAATLLGQILLAQDAINSRDLDKALVAQQQMGGRLGALLMRSGALSETQLLQALHTQLQLPLLVEDVPVPEGAQLQAGLAATGADLGWLLQNECALWLADDQLYCLAEDLFAPLLNEWLLRNVQQPVQFVLARRHQLEAVLLTLKGLWQEQQDDMPDATDVRQLRELAEEAPVVELVNNIMSMALEERASDIHIEPEPETFDIRYRIDGVLHTRRTLPKQRYYAVASRLKLVSGIDIAERRLPQDGRIGMRINGQDLDVRVSSLPGVHGESIVMRLLPKEREDLQLERLGLLPDHLQQMRALARRPHGIVLVTGPTGSGKSTTLYATLDQSNDGQRKIITVEDPVEVQMPHLTQVQVHSDIGLSFARALRSILRQDPDVIMIGEIRDLETAEIAVQSALTGHLVLSTLHTNDALSAFTRLVDMGIEPFLAATPVIAVQAQRLVRRLCPHCREPSAEPQQYAEQAAHWSRLALDKEQAASWYQAKGCQQCGGTGYRGRLGIYELVEVSEAMRELVLHSASLPQLREQARSEGYRDMFLDGLIKARSGLTTVEEVLRVTSMAT